MTHKAQDMPEVPPVSSSPTPSVTGVKTKRQSRRKKDGKVKEQSSGDAKCAAGTGGKKKL